jgi:hypothetical protein
MLLRRFVEGPDSLMWDDNRNRWRVRSGAVVIDPDGISCYLDSTLRDLGFAAADVAAAGKGDLVAGLRIEDVRTAGCGVVRDPQDSPADIGPAHALITFDAESSRRSIKRQASAVMQAAEIVSGTVRRSPP